MNAITAHHNPVHTTTIHREDNTIEYLFRGPTEGSLEAPINRTKMSFPSSDIFIGIPCMVRGDVEVRMLVHPR